MTTTAKNSIKKRIHSAAMSFVFAFRGLKQVLMQESNLRLELALGILTLIACALFNCSTTEWALVLLCCALVLSSEIFNSVVEEFLDWKYPEEDKIVGKIKDMAAAAPLVASLFAFAIGGVIFFPKILKLINTFL